MKNLIGKMITIMMILIAAECLIAVFFYPKFSLGVLMGGGGALVNLFSLWYDINRAVERRKTPKGFIGRYVFNAVLMLLGGLISLSALLGVFVGLVNLKISAYLLGWRGRM